MDFTFDRVRTFSRMDIHVNREGAREVYHDASLLLIQVDSHQ